MHRVACGAMSGALLTDLYELTMAASYLRRDMRELATFSLYVRTQPPTRGFLVAAGLEPALGFLESVSFSEDELAFCHERLGFDQQTIDAFRDLTFDGDVWAVAEGRVVAANEPLLEVTAPIAQAQLVETMLLNTITTQTTLASKAARYRLAADGRELADFAFRRSHGVDAAMAVARASALAGFGATSNAEAARRFDLAATGTMAHSFVESFPTELDAFRAYGRDNPERSTFLVDTYETAGGVRAAIEAIRELGLAENLAIRLDSGDLDALSRDARSALDEAGLRGVRIVASGGLGEIDVAELVASGAPIDVFGIGTQLGVSADAPGMDSVYKLVEFDGRPMMKLSPAKSTLPGRKQVFRAAGRDVLSLRDDPAPEGGIPLLEQVMAAGRRTRAAPPLAESRARLEDDLAWLPADAKRLSSPSPVSIEISPALHRLTDETRKLLGG
jgi:nicotinate phosphoribosyltransferase